MNRLDFLSGAFCRPDCSFHLRPGLSDQKLLIMDHFFQNCGPVRFGFESDDFSDRVDAGHPAPDIFQILGKPLFHRGSARTRT